LEKWVSDLKIRLLAQFGHAHNGLLDSEVLDSAIYDVAYELLSVAEYRVFWFLFDCTPSYPLVVVNLNRRGYVYSEKTVREYQRRALDKLLDKTGSNLVRARLGISARP
jgi:hypothetical protein